MGSADDDDARVPMRALRAKMQCQKGECSVVGENDEFAFV